MAKGYTPFRQNFGWCVSPGSTPMGPIEEAARRIGAEKMFLWQNFHATEVKTIGVPAGLDSGIGFREAIGVQAAGLVEEIKPRVIEVQKRASEGAGEVAAAQAMPAIDVFVDPARIVEEGEKLHHLDIGSVGIGNLEAILHDSCPVDYPMRAESRQRVLAQNFTHDSAAVVHEGAIQAAFRLFFKGRFGQVCILQGQS